MKRKRYSPEKALKSWRTAVKSVTKMSIDELSEAIIYEMQQKTQRKDVMVRLTRRYGKLCAEKSKKELLNG
jgi:hypothetical protein